MYDGNEMWMENDEEIRFRVESVRFPARPLSAEKLSVLTPLEGGAPGPAFSPMVVVVRPGRRLHALCSNSPSCYQGDINSDSGLGLGIVSWWAGDDAAAEMEAGE